MTKCKNCETEEQGYGTALDKRGYCYKPHCQSCSYDEVEQQNTCLQAQLDREIHINRKMKNALESISKQFDKIDFGDFEKDFICKTSRLTLKEIDNKE